MTDDRELLKRFRESGDENAFRELVDRHIDLVYSTAARVLNGDTHLAQDVAQTVFADLSRKAHSLKADVVIPGWLYEAARFAASKMARTEQRRRARELKAVTMEDSGREPLPKWEDVAAELDDAMAELNAPDRNALVLRFFQNRDLRAVGAALGVTDDSAQKRVSRAVERLRQNLTRRGVVVGATALGTLLAANTIQAAPPALAALAATSATTTAAKTGLTITFAGLKAKMALVACAGLLVVAGGFVPWSGSDGNSARLPLGNGVAKVSMGGWHGAILATDGSLWVWGENFGGWPVLASTAVERQPKLRHVAPGSTWVDVSTSFTHCLALNADGSVWSWGQNLYGQLGPLVTGTESSTPRQALPGNDWKQVAAGGAHSIALRRDGTLWAWGVNWAGQLGVGSAQKEIHEPTQVGSETNWLKVWACGIQTVGLRADGTLWFWGSLTGDADDTNRFYAPHRISADTNWSEVGFGYFVVFAIKTDGTLWAWGRNAGIYTGAPIQVVNATPGRVGSDADWKSCSISEYFFQLLEKKDGSLWALDASDYAVINKAAYKPFEIRPAPLRRPVIAYGAAGRGVTGVGVTANGEVWTWGRDLGRLRGDYPSIASIAERAGWKSDWFKGKPITKPEPWMLPRE